MNNPSRFFKDIDDTFDGFNNSMMDSDAFFDFIKAKKKMTNESKNETMNQLNYITNFANVIEISKGTIFEDCPWKLIRLEPFLKEHPIIGFNDFKSFSEVFSNSFKKIIFIRTMILFRHLVESNINFNMQKLSSKTHQYLKETQFLIQ